MRTPFSDLERTSSQDIAEQEKLQNSELPEASETKNETDTPVIPESDEVSENNENTETDDTRILDDDGNEINEDDLGNKTFVLNGVEYQTDDNGEIYLIDGERIANNTYVLDGKEYQTDDNGELMLTAEEKEKIKEETGWSDEIIDAIGSWKEYEIYKNAGLVESEVGGKKCLIRDDIDWDQKDSMGNTNRERAKDGLSPINKDGKVIELHHIGQHADSPLAELTMQEHRGKGNDTILHDKTKESEIDRQAFKGEKNKHWEARAQESDGMA